MLKNLPLLLALAVFPAACAPGAAQGVGQTAPFTLERPDLLCALVIEKVTTRVRPYTYLYQKEILEAAGVGLRDSPEVEAQKVQELWSRYEDQLICNNPQASAQNGNLIKLGIDQEFDPFINDILRWGVNLNRIDADGTTVLDFIQSQITKYAGSSAERKLRRYYVRFREAGALHRSELP